MSKVNWGVAGITVTHVSGMDRKGEARPAGLEPATSWFVAANVGRSAFDFIGVSMLCHAGLPRGQAEDVAFNYG
jgi:hypothetical protein